MPARIALSLMVIPIVVNKFGLDINNTDNINNNINNMNNVNKIDSIKN